MITLAERLIAAEEKARKLRAAFITEQNARIPTKLIHVCPNCGSGDVRWCHISVRPYCGDCGTWGRVNFGSAQESISRWNEKVVAAFPEMDFSDPDNPTERGI